ncbi:MAG TPA: POTRA domain-containing protein [Terriglobales bacterium]|nr:POTRA domain-containing protein [Terriglobales bacterium]
MRLLVILVLGFCATGVAEVSYEGQPVSSINVIANPHLDAGKFRAFIVQKPGQPYSEKDVQASIAALKKNGSFPSVDVHVTPEAAGLRLTFILEPAYYVGMLNFPGATKTFTYSRLLQVVNIPDEAAFDKEKLPDSETALRHFLETNGFYQSTVKANTLLDDAHRIANIIFTINLGKRARIGQVSIQGASAEETAKLLRSVRSLRARLTGGLLKPGKSYSPERMRSATALVKRELAKQNYLANKVQANPPEYHAETNRLDVSFNVTVGPTVDVRVAGAKLSFLPFLSRRNQRRLIPIYDEGSVDRDLVNEGQRNLEDFFQQKGYFDAKVDTKFQKQNDKISIVYTIDKGEKHKVNDIKLEGNRHLSSEQLASVVTVKKRRLFSHGLFSQKLLRQSIDNIQALYRDNGYEDVKVDSQAIDHEPNVDVVFKITEGLQTIVESLQVIGNSALPLSEIEPSQGFRLREGAPFSPGSMSQDRNRISAKYLDLGYLNAEVKATAKRSPNDSHRVTVTYDIAEHQEVRISEVIYLGQKRTRQAFISKSAGISAGAPLSEGKLLATESTLYNLGIFDWSSVGPKAPVTTQTEEDALVKVHEAPRNTVTYGFGFEVTRRGGNVPTGTIAVPGLPTIGTGNAQIVPSEATFVGPRGSIQYTRRNMRGQGETAAISLVLARLEQRAVATYIDPDFRLSQWNSLTSLSYWRTTENPLFAADLADASFQLERPFGSAKSTRLQIRYDFNKTILAALLVPQLVLPRDRNVRLSTVSSALIRDTRDKPLDAHHGIFSTVNFAITPTAFGSNANFTKFLGQYAFYKPVHSMVWANSLRLGLAKAFSGSFVPTSQEFFAGGGTTLRGFPLNGAGPQRIVPFCGNPVAQTNCANISVPVGGNQLFILNSELRFPLRILENLGAAVFYDGGNVYRAINFNDFVNNYTNTVGIGMRYHTPVGPVRFDVGHNLNPLPGVGSTQYFITLGEAF